jgi:hypothetical protein
MPSPTFYSSLFTQISLAYTCPLPAFSISPDYRPDIIIYNSVILLYSDLGFRIPWNPTAHSPLCPYIGNQLSFS